MWKQVLEIQYHSGCLGSCIKQQEGINLINKDNYSLKALNASLNPAIISWASNVSAV